MTRESHRRAFITERLIRTWLKPRHPLAHKGRFGHVLVVAGSRGMTGAARLCAEAALRAGAGLVTLALPKSQWTLVVRRSRPEMMTFGLPETSSGTIHEKALPEVRRFLRKHDVTSLVVGPGLGLNPHIRKFLKGLFSTAILPTVVDADALNALADKDTRSVRWTALKILTPHPGEMGRLLGISTRWVQRDRAAAALRLARSRKVLCVLKGHRSVVTDGQTVFLNSTGNAGMATGGSGDVLAGVIAALAGQVTGETVALRLWRAALVGVFVHGLAGDLAARQRTKIGLVAGDLIEFLPAAFRKTFGKRI